MAELTNLLMLPGAPVVPKYNALVSATTGVLSLDVAGAADVTLTSAQAAHFLIVLTGALTGDIIIKVPQREKPYIFLNSTTGDFRIVAQPVTSGAATELIQSGFARVMCDGVDVFSLGPQMTQAGSTFQFYYSETAAVGPFTAGYRAGGTAASPGLVGADWALYGVHGLGWARNAANTANEWVRVGRVRILVGSIDAQDRIGGMIDFNVSPGVSAGDVARMRLDKDGQLLLGNPVTSTDKVTLKQADILGVAGNSGLQIVDETGVVTSIGKGLLRRRLLITTTAGVGSPLLLTAEQSDAVITNEGATAMTYITLPTPIAGLSYTFYCRDTDGIHITAGAGHTIRIASSNSASGGFIETVTLGNMVTLLAVNTTQWASMGHEGTWTVT